MSDKPLIFVSCGQYTTAEKNLGADVSALIRDVRQDLEPYFADSQSTAEGLSSHVLKALFRAAGFICIMHRRGNVVTPDGKTTITRGSVWLEQEIAVAAFMTHALGRSMPIFFYQQAGVSLEGIRSVLHMNPRVEFAQESEVLDNLRAILPNTVFSAYAEYDLDAVTSYKDVTIQADRHTYSFVADVKNVGRQRVTDFQLRVFFPRAFLNPNTTWAAEDANRSTRTHICLVADGETRATKGLYPGDTLSNPLTIEYFVDEDLLERPAAMQSTIQIELFSGSMTPKKIPLRIADFQKF